MIDIEKFICSLLADHPVGVTVREDIHKALKDQGLEYKGGKIVPIEDKTALQESEGERIRKAMIKGLSSCGTKYWGGFEIKAAIAWLEKQGKQKEINLVEILKHYPKETELYSPLYGKLWLAEVDEKNEIITCYKHPLDEGCTRAVLEQEDTVSFYSNGTTGLPDFNVSKDCMLFLYNIEKQDEHQDVTIQINPSEYINDMGGNGCYLKNTTQIPIDNDIKEALHTEYEKGRADAIAEMQLVWSEEDEKIYNRIYDLIHAAAFANYDVDEDGKELGEYAKITNWLKSLKDRILSKQEWSEEDKVNQKIEKLKTLADAMYYAAQYLTTDASRLHKAMNDYHQFVIQEITY